MSFPSYPRYKDIGLAWLGDIPEQWNFVPFWSCFRRSKRTDFPDEELLSVYRDYGVVRKADRDDNFNNPSEDLACYQLVEPGDLVINKMKAWQGSVAISCVRGIVSPAYFVYRPTHQCCSRFLHYLMRSLRYITGYLSISKGVRINQWDLDPIQHSMMPILVPSLDEQNAIASFLDEETARIDAVIGEQQRLIASLKDKREAVISQAVTKGLDPAVPMKSSGFEWIGRIPKNWIVCRTKHVSEIFVPQRNKPELNPDVDGVPWVTMENIKDDKIVPGRFHVSSSAMVEAAIRILPAGAVLASCIGNFGVAAVTDEEIVINQQLQAFIPNGELLAGFMQYWITHAKPYFEQVSTAATIPYVNQQGFADMPIVLPPKHEQVAIMNFLNQANKEVDDLSDQADRAITLLQERRSALISAAVTGKIDVRSYNPTRTEVLEELYEPA